jgi:hypothetical protein
MSDKRFDEICNLVRESYKNSCILFIDEVENPDLYSRYLEYKSTVEANRGAVDEKLLFHNARSPDRYYRQGGV